VVFGPVEFWKTVLICGHHVPDVSRWSLLGIVNIMKQSRILEGEPSWHFLLTVMALLDHTTWRCRIAASCVHETGACYSGCLHLPHQMSSFNYRRPTPAVCQDVKQATQPPRITLDVGRRWLSAPAANIMCRHHRRPFLCDGLAVNCDGRRPDHRSAAACPASGWLLPPVDLSQPQSVIS